ncbi:hypothetical protein, partial [Bacillus sp. MBGLi79]|uniref:hypothetical protein n=1 Tax=Bacillus sp. MBGLi79 TaxID=2070759 RepID=UPI001E489F6C
TPPLFIIRFIIWRVDFAAWTVKITEGKKGCPNGRKKTDDIETNQNKEPIFHRPKRFILYLFVFFVF